MGLPLTHAATTLSSRAADTRTVTVPRFAADVKDECFAGEGYAGAFADGSGAARGDCSAFRSSRGSGCQRPANYNSSAPW